MKKELRTTFITRQYMLSKDFEIYYYNDKDLKAVHKHSHDYYEFYFFLEGNVNIKISDKEYPLQYGDLVIIPPRTLHRPVIQNNEKPYRRFVFWISQDYSTQLNTLSPAYNYLFQRVNQTQQYIYHYDNIAYNTLQAKVLQLIEEIHSDRYGKEAKVALCVNDLILHLNRTIHEQYTKPTKDSSINLYQDLVTYIESHLDETLTLETLANIFFVSKYYIAHIFKDNMGISTHQYILKKRLSMCKDAMINGDNINEACTAYGFSDYSNFYRAFIKEYGVSPKKYRDEILRNAGWLKDT
ncbi:MAG: AraC family transcriptional regulator [Lachnospiraceae bacterium]|nr:AraC family transcriptional regulator [Lachnospiraceae bacterium]MDD3616952.1 AraC family transcriptional regulator [Lachnospiraceae bacterium]